MGKSKTGMMKIYDKENKIQYLKDIIEAIEYDELQYLWISHKRDIDRIEYDDEVPEIIYGGNYEIKINMKYDKHTSKP